MQKRSYLSEEKRLELDAKLKIIKKKTTSGNQIRKLLDSGADPNRDLYQNHDLERIAPIFNNEERYMLQGSALFTAIQHNHNEGVELLLKFGANLRIEHIDRTGQKETALHAAIKFGDLTTVSLLLRYGADVNADSYEGTALCVVIKNCHVNAAKIMSLLLQHGADVNAPGSSSYTPLLHAINIPKRLLAKEKHDLESAITLSRV
jgi:ankyrin repeat protein